MNKVPEIERPQSRVLIEELEFSQPEHPVDKKPAPLQTTAQVLEMKDLAPDPLCFDLISFQVTDPSLDIS